MEMEDNIVITRNDNNKVEEMIMITTLELYIIIIVL